MKHCTISEADLKRVYGAYKSDMMLEEFRSICHKLVTDSNQPNESVLNQITTGDRKTILQSFSNFAMKGHGFGVLK